MKKVLEIIKPLLFIILGALLFLTNLNGLQTRGDQLLISASAVVSAAYYIIYGVITLLFWDKLPAMLRKVLDMFAASLFPIFMFIMFVIIVKNLHNGFGPTNWIMIIGCLVSSVLVPITFVIASLTRNKLVDRIAQLSGSIFALILILIILMDVTTGDANRLGDIQLTTLAIYVCFVVSLFKLLKTLESSEPVEKEIEEHSSIEESSETTNEELTSAEETK